MPGSDAAAFVSAALTDRERLLASRVHPIAIFAAQKQYAAGRGLRGSGAWTPVGAVLDALSAAFPLAFGNVTPTGKRLQVALDVSCSMAHASVAGLENCRAFEVAAAMALVHANVEPHGNVVYSAFDTTTKRFVVAKDDAVERVAARIAEFAGGGTDLSLAVTAAREDAVAPDAIVIYTDSETWAGRGHLMPHFDAFRADRNRNAKLAICSTMATGFSAADQKRDDVLQTCGFDTTVPTVLAQFLTN